MTVARWWGWGVTSRQFPADKTRRVLAYLHSLGFPRSSVDCAVPLARRVLREPLLALDGVPGSRDGVDRLLHACGKSYRDLLRLRRGWISHLPDVVTRPGSAEEVRSLLETAAELGVAVVPFGGGTSVVGGVEGPPGRPYISLDLRGLNRLVRLDPVSRLATFEAGVLGPDLERELGEHGLTLGHFPQSFEFSTLGGWVAARSAGQSSTFYGKIESMVQSLKVETPGGTFASLGVPACAAGPDLRQVMIGSEGVLGVITEVTVRVVPRPTQTRWKCCLMNSFEEAADELRRLVQAGFTPAVARLSDPDETRFMLGSEAGWRARLLRARGGCLLLLGCVDEAVPPVRGGLDLGSGAGRSWERTRFDLPYLRDDLMDAGIMVDTLETATTWANLLPLYRRIRSALEPHGQVLTHVSHLYPDGASLYVTILAPQLQGDELGQWERAKTAATEAIVLGGGTLSHHHGVGTDHSGWLGRELGGPGLRMLEALKRELDPRGVLNPGKLVS